MFLQIANYSFTICNNESTNVYLSFTIYNNSAHNQNFNKYNTDISKTAKKQCLVMSKAMQADSECEKYIWPVGWTFTAIDYYT